MIGSDSDCNLQEYRQDAPHTAEKQSVRTVCPSSTRVCEVSNWLIIWEDHAYFKKSRYPYLQVETTSPHD